MIPITQIAILKGGLDKPKDPPPPIAPLPRINDQENLYIILK
jgi:hypothetical protein